MIMNYLSLILRLLNTVHAKKHSESLGNPSVNELSKKLDLERTTVLRNLNKLKKMDLISYKKNELYKVKIIKPYC